MNHNRNIATATAQIATLIKLKPTEEMIQFKATEIAASQPKFTEVVKVVKNKKKAKWFLRFNWKNTLPDEQFPSEAIALAAQEAYELQNAASKRVYDMFQKDFALEHARAELMDVYNLTLQKKGAAVARLTAHAARADLSRMATLRRR